MSDFSIERRLWGKGYKLIAGVDEVGRGPLAGHLITAAVVFPVGSRKLETAELERNLAGVDDSKKLTASRRIECMRRIKHLALDWSISGVSPAEIDRIGIGKAIAKAHAGAIFRLKVIPDYILVDGKRALTAGDFDNIGEHSGQYANIKSTSIIKGDSISLSIAAASIIAKVTRDRMLTFAARQLPDYGFEHHKGYGTAEHLRQLKSLGPTNIHRFSFAPLKNEELRLDE